MRAFINLPIDCYEITIPYQELLKSLNEIQDDNLDKGKIETTITKQGIYFNIHGIHIGGIDA